MVPRLFTPSTHPHKESSPSSELSSWPSSQSESRKTLRRSRSSSWPVPFSSRGESRGGRIPAFVDSNHILAIQHALKIGAEIFPPLQFGDLSITPHNYPPSGLPESLSATDPSAPAAEQHHQPVLVTKEYVLGLRREMLMLRNELNLQMSLKQENPYRSVQQAYDEVNYEAMEMEMQFQRNHRKRLESDLAKLYEIKQRQEKELKHNNKNRLRWEGELRQKLTKYREEKRLEFEKSSQLAEELERLHQRNERYRQELSEANERLLKASVALEEAEKSNRHYMLTKEAEQELVHQIMKWDSESREEELGEQSVQRLVVDQLRSHKLLLSASEREIQQLRLQLERQTLAVQEERDHVLRQKKEIEQLKSIMQQLEQGKHPLVTQLKNRLRVLEDQVRWLKKELSEKINTGENLDPTMHICTMATSEKGERIKE